MAETFQQKGVLVSADAFAHAERALAADLGLTQKALRVVRSEHLDRITDWQTVAGEVRYSDQGKDRLLAVLKISSDSAPPAAVVPAIVAPPLPSEPASVSEKISSEPAAAPEPAPLPVRAPGDQEDLLCHKCYVPNRRIVEAKTAAGELVLVRVRDNGNLRPGMVMKCRFAGGRMWELAQRLPRFRGKW